MIETELISDDFGYLGFIRVWNRGAAATFRAQIQLTGEDVGRDAGGIYDAYWNQSADSEVKIFSGHQAVLHVADGGGPRSASGDEEVALVFLHPDGSRGQFMWSWGMPGPKQFFLRVTISSEPKLRDGEFVRTYTLGPLGLVEVPDA